MNGPNVVHLFLMVLVLICFILAFLKRFEPQVSIGWLGLFILVLDAMIFGAQALKS